MRAAATTEWSGEKFVGDLSQAGAFVVGQFGRFVDDRVLDGCDEPQVTNLLFAQAVFGVADEFVKPAAGTAVRAFEVLLDRAGTADG